MYTPDAKRWSNSDLSEDVILEILLRLPVKTLLRFKCVCKEWYAIIVSQSFVNQHYRHKSNNERLLVGRYKHNVCHPEYALYVDDTLSACEEPSYLQIPNTVRRVMGPVNGVFCLVGERGDLALLNPATRQLKPLPKQPDVVLFEPHLRFHENMFGFGLDLLSGDYKVVSIRYLWDDSVNALDRNPVVFVYNSGNNSWRYVTSLKSSYTARNPSLYVNGVYYWNFRDTNVAGILAFDMSTEMFEEIEVPNCVASKWGYLSVRNDSIAMLACDLEKVDVFEVWVMEEGGRWNRVAVVNSFHDNMSLPVCLWKNNELLLLSNTSAFALYNMICKNIKIPAALLRQNTSFISSLFSYKESLVSIKGEGDNCMFWDASADTLSLAWA